MTKINKLLIANRGEIAVRIMRTAKQMAYRTVAVYSEADRDSLHVQCADDAIEIGAANASESYLSIDSVIAAAQTVDADAIHPGYGFLSENAEFAEACSKAGILFIGPSPAAIRVMGSKRQSKLAMLQHQVPCIPGYQGEQQDDQTLISEAEKISWPLMIKASAGGGGRGMRVVTSAADFLLQLNMARSEALSAFGSDEMILERALQNPRHIEIQIFADSHGNVVHLGERDCSIQRRHQKLLEESPSPFVDADLRTRMGAAAIQAARACDYVGAGTVEFLVDEQGEFYFLEMNTRLQVEHPVTEMIADLDLVEWQLLVAEGNELPLKQDEVKLKGHAIEVRLYAEDPRQDFIPQTGLIAAWQPPQTKNPRTDSGIQTGQTISPYYDPLLAKIISFGQSRDLAIANLTQALCDTVLLGVNNNKLFLQSVLENKTFQGGNATTAFLNQEFPDKQYQDPDPDARIVAVAALLFYKRLQSKYPSHAGGWRSAVRMRKTFCISYQGADQQVMIENEYDNYWIETAGQHFKLVLKSNRLTANICHFIEDTQQSSVHYCYVDDDLYLDDGNGHFSFQDNTYRSAEAAIEQGESQIKAPMDGAIVEVMVVPGESVEQGQVVAILEAMKMAHQIKAGTDGLIENLAIEVGQQVKSRQLLMQISRC